MYFFGESRRVFTMAKEPKETKKLSAVERVQATYAKNERAKGTVSLGMAPKIYTEADGVPIPEDHPFRELTGIPCLPFNKVIQFAGKPDTGKSSQGAVTVVAGQAAGFEVIYWDSEEKFDPNRLVMLGGDPNKINFVRTNDILIGAQMVKELIIALKEDKPKCNILFVWDSVGGGLSRSNIQTNLATRKGAQPGAEAKENGEAIRHIVTMMNVYRDSICAYLANQTYAKIGMFQKGDKAKGGDGVEFFSSYIVFTKRLKVLTQTINKQIYKTGIITECTVTKNHLTQGKNSVYKMRFQIDAEGVKKSDFEFKNETEKAEAEAAEEAREE